ncbi:beta-ketoacyl synthase [Thermostilla marina]
MFFTGVGPVSPIGIGWDAVRATLEEKRSGIGPITLFDASGLPVRAAAEVKDFDAKKMTKARKQLKVMARDAQLGVASARFAAEHGKFTPGCIPPERVGVVFGADRICGPLEDSEPPYRACIENGHFHFERWATDGFAATFPLSFLKVLPNMIGSHISITLDARGPNNTIHHTEVSSTLAVAEAAGVLQRGLADLIVTGGAGSQVSPYDWVRHCVMGRLSTDESNTPRPFTQNRNGEVRGEAAVSCLLETEQSAEARGVEPIAELLGYGSAFSGPRAGGPRTALVRAIGTALEQAGLKSEDLGGVIAHGWATQSDDSIEAAALAEVVPGVPVTAPSSYYGIVGAGQGAMGVAFAIACLEMGALPPTLHGDEPDQALNLDVVFGESRPLEKKRLLVVNWVPAGQAAALIVGSA